MACQEQGGDLAHLDHAYRINALGNCSRSELEVGAEGLLRRRIVMAAAALVPAAAIGSELRLDRGFWDRPRRLWVRRPATNEEAAVVYFAEDQVQLSGYLELCRLFRDVQSGETVHIDLVLFDALCGAQGYLNAVGRSAPWIINSGYRSAKTNARLEGAALDSMHVKGKASDGFFPGLSWGDQAAIVRYYAAGGLGWYPSRGFVHVDTGRTRQWRG